jgi:hypothetical protein
MTPPCCLYPPDKLLNARTYIYETWYSYHGTLARLNSVLHKSPISLYVYTCTSPILARQRLCKNFSAVTNIFAKIEELFDAPFSMRSVSYQRKVAD